MATGLKTAGRISAGIGVALAGLTTASLVPQTSAHLPSWLASSITPHAVPLLLASGALLAIGLVLSTLATLMGPSGKARLGVIIGAGMVLFGAIGLTLSMHSFTPMSITTQSAFLLGIGIAILLLSMVASLFNKEPAPGGGKAKQHDDEGTEMARPAAHN